MFQVIWLQEALDELAEIWLHPDSKIRKAITAAVDAIDQELGVDPFRQSESRDEQERVLFVYPVAVQFEVDLAQRVVWIAHAWRFRRRDEE